MPDKSDRKIIRSNGGFIQDITTYIKLVVRLMGDGRVNPLLKLLPIGSLIYLVFPLDIPGPLDDAAVIGLSFYLFIEMCPPDVVDEHKRAIQIDVPGEWRDPHAAEENIDDADVIDAEYREE